LGAYHEALQGYFVERQKGIQEAIDILEQDMSLLGVSGIEE